MTPPAFALAGLGIEVRRAVVGELTEAGMSTRAIAPVVGVSNKTVHEDREAEYGGAAFMVPRAERPELVARMRAQGLTQQEIADTAGVHRETVAKDIRSMSESGIEVEPPTITNARGQQRPASYKTSEPTEPATPAKPKRGPLTEDARRTGWDLDRLTSQGNPRPRFLHLVLEPRIEADNYRPIRLRWPIPYEDNLARRTHPYRDRARVRIVGLEGQERPRQIHEGIRQQMSNLSKRLIRAPKGLRADPDPSHGSPPRPRGDADALEGTPLGAVLATAVSADTPPCPALDRGQSRPFIAGAGHNDNLRTEAREATAWDHGGWSG